MSVYQAQSTLEANMYRVYEYFGSATVLVNILTIVIFLRDRSLRDRHLFILIAVGDILNGIYFAYSSFERLKEMKSPSYYSLISPWNCATKLYAAFQIIGSQLPDIAALMISIERVLAVLYPFWYRAKFTTYHRIGLLLFCIFFCTISLAIYFLTVFSLQQKTVPWACCMLTFSSHPIYNRAHQAFIIIVQIMAFGLSAFAFVKAQNKSGAVVAMRKEAQSMKALVAVNLFSVTLVTAPQICLLSMGFLGLQVNGWALYIILMLPCVNSFMNFFVYLWLTEKFRNQFVRTIFCRKIGHQSSNVTTVAIIRPRINQVSSKI